MVKQKIVLKLKVGDERKKRKAFKDGLNYIGMTSATTEGDKIRIVVDGVDPIMLTTILRRGMGYTELLGVSSGDDKKRDSYGYGYGEEKKKDGYSYGGAEGGGGMSFSSKDSSGSYYKGGSGGGGGYHQNAMVPVSYPAYQQYNTMPSYPVHTYPPYHQQQEYIPVAA